jgi:glycosyltransferase involved in cell wall biosynthesis
MNPHPLVSVLIPTYNSEKTILRALSSVAAQTLQPIEVIVVDDGSTDGTVSLVKNICSELMPGNLKLVELKSNRGTYYARNIGWDMASGEFLAFLDSDDSWHPQKLEIQVNYMINHTDLHLTAHRCIVRLSDNDKLPKIPQHWHATPITRRQLMFFSCSLWTPSIIIRRDVPYRFDPFKRCLEDRMLLLQMALNGHKITRLELPLVYLYKVPYGESGLSRSLWKSEKNELDIFSRLRRMGLLNRGQEIVLKGWSFLKYIQRVLAFRRRRYVT